MGYRPVFAGPIRQVSRPVEPVRTVTVIFQRSGKRPPRNPLTGTNGRYK